MGLPALLLGIGIAVAPVALADLQIASDTMTIEHTPGRIAAEDYFAGEASIVEGGIAALVRRPLQVQLGTNAEIPSLKTYATNKNLRIIHTMTETYYRIVANRASGIETVADLAGKRIASFPTTTAAYFAETFLQEKAGLNVSAGDFELVFGSTCFAQPCPRNSMPAQILSGAIDAIALWEPTPQVAIDMLGDDAVIFQDRAFYREIVNLQTTTDALEDPVVRAEIVEFVKAVLRAQRAFNEEPETLYQRVADIVGSDAGVIERAWDVHGWRGGLPPDLVDVLIKEEKYVAALQNREPWSDDEVAALVDTSVLEEAMAGLDAEDTGEVDDSEAEEVPSVPVEDAPLEEGEVEEEEVVVEDPEVEEEVTEVDAPEEEVGAPLEEIDTPEVPEEEAAEEEEVDEEEEEEEDAPDEEIEAPEAPEIGVEDPEEEGEVPELPEEEPEEEALDVEVPDEETIEIPEVEASEEDSPEGETPDKESEDAVKQVVEGAEEDIGIVEDVEEDVEEEAEEEADAVPFLDSPLPFDQPIP